jgi:hypothetical protein
MLDWLRGNKDPNQGSDQDYSGHLNALLSRVESVIEHVRGIKNNLDDSYPAEALSSLSRRFEEIDKDFTDYHIIKRNTYYEIIHKSNSRLTAVKNVSREAKIVAQLFERYARRPNTYSASNSRSKINRLQGQLRNLKDCCMPDN